MHEDGWLEAAHEDRTYSPDYDPHYAPMSDYEFYGDESDCINMVDFCSDHNQDVELCIADELGCVQ